MPTGTGDGSPSSSACESVWSHWQLTGYSTRAGSLTARSLFLRSLTYLLGLVPTIVACRLDLNRGYRAIGLFFWWFGIVVMVGGLRRTCLVSYARPNGATEHHPAPDLIAH